MTTAAPEPGTAPAGEAGEAEHHRVAIIGTGFGGLGMAIRLLQAGERDVVLLEKADDVGGTWRDNTYPGIQCDVPSNLYSFSFAPNPEWTRTFAWGGEIQRYLQHCADRYGVRPHIRFGTLVQEARWDDEAQRWAITTASGRYTADVLVSAHGGLSAPSVPDFPGLDSFEGTVFHSAAWDHDHDLTGERVAVIGTGASSIQIVPAIQPQVGELKLFQRTPPWIVPRPDRPFKAGTRTLFKRLPLTQKLARAGIYWSREALVVGLAKRPKLMRFPEKLARAHLEHQVTDPVLRAKLTPTYSIGCKRILLSNDYYPALTQPNVDVVTDSIVEITPKGVRTADGTEHIVDTIILSTGFKVTDHPVARAVVGKDGRSLSEHWADGMHSYLGTTVEDFPNLFMITGPNTGLGHTSMVFMMEAQFTYILGALDVLRDRGVATVEVRPDAVRRFTDEMQRKLAGSVWNSGCASWYLDSQGRNTTVWPTFTWSYRRRTQRFDPESYVLGSRR